MAATGREGVLILFVKHPEEGKVKTRLAKTVGAPLAVRIYEGLLERTRSQIVSLSVDIQVHYGEQPVAGDAWEAEGYARFAQQGSDLGARMRHAFRQAFAQGYSKVIIIGSDCYQLTRAHLEEAFQALDQMSAVLGPSTDGGYYLLGMNKLLPAVFENKSWSTESVAEDTRSDFRKEGFGWKELEPLTDIDTENDLGTIPLGVLADWGYRQ